MARARFARGDLLLLVAVLSVFGLVDSLDLAALWYAHASASWCDFGGIFSCTTVSQSWYAAIGGVPTAWVGVAGFAILLGLSVLGLRGVDRVGPWSVDRWILVFAILGALVGLGLTFIEIFVIYAVCVLCVIGFVLDLGILAAAILLVRATGDPEAGG